MTKLGKDLTREVLRRLYRWDVTARTSLSGGGVALTFSVKGRPLSFWDGVRKRQSTQVCVTLSPDGSYVVEAL